MTATLSIVLIVKNEALNLAQCLESVQGLKAEIVILDGGSTDDTEQIARIYTNKFFQEISWQGYGKHRQIAQAYATSDWVIMLDADERFTPELIQEIKLVLQQNDQSKIYSLPRLSWAFGAFIRYGGWYPDFVDRLYPRTKTQYNNSLVHEKLLVPNNMRREKLKGTLLHYTYKDLQHYLEKSAKYAELWAQQRYAKGKTASLSQGLSHGIFYFLKMYIFRLGFLDGRQGLLLALLSAHSVFAKYASLWIKYQKKWSE